MFDTNKLPENDNDEPKPGANQEPPRKPKRIVHRPKIGAHSGDANLRPVSLLRSRSASSKFVKGQPEVTLPLQTGPIFESIKANNLPIHADTTNLPDTSDASNPGQRLRDLENAGKIFRPHQSSDRKATKPADSNLPKHSRRPPLPLNGDMTRRAYWDVGSALSFIVNIILLAVVVIMAIQINTLRSSLNYLLGGLFNNFVRMDNSVISTTINMTDVPIPLDFNLPVVQQETNVTLTRPVTIQSAHVTINSGPLTINNAPATITLPQGTILPVSLQMDIPVQTTVFMNLNVPVNIKLAEANSPDANVGNLHTAFVGLQDTIGPMYCHFNPKALDYLNNFLCNNQGNYIRRSTAPNP